LGYLLLGHKTKRPQTYEQKLPSCCKLAECFCCCPWQARTIKSNYLECTWRFFTVAIGVELESEEWQDLARDLAGNRGIWVQQLGFVSSVRLCLGFVHSVPAPISSLQVNFLQNDASVWMACGFGHWTFEHSPVWRCFRHVNNAGDIYRKSPLELTTLTTRYAGVLRIIWLGGRICAENQIEIASVLRGVLIEIAVQSGGQCSSGNKSGKKKNRKKMHKKTGTRFGAHARESLWHIFIDYSKWNIS